MLLLHLRSILHSSVSAPFTSTSYPSLSHPYISLSLSLSLSFSPSLSHPSLSALLTAWDSLGIHTATGYATTGNVGAKRLAEDAAKAPVVNSVINERLEVRNILNEGESRDSGHNILERAEP
jgi:hypothetical protein